MRTFFLIGLVLMMSACAESQVNEGVNNTGYEVVDPDKFKELLADEDIQLVDVRTPGEFAEGSIENAVNIDVMAPDFSTKMAELDKSKKTLIYCKSGTRSGRAAQTMKEMGFETIIDLSGGYSAWPFK